MNNPIQSARVQRFKGISDASFDAEPINVLIGANNSGKSTLAQAIHFGVGVLQAIDLAGKWTRGQRTALSLSPAQLHYSPCADLYALGYGGHLKEDAGSAIIISLVLADGQKVDIAVRKGRNGNIHVTVDNTPAAKTLADLENPYTIYSPGLAGIARSETYISNGVLMRTIARGDANLVLRNILLRLSEPGCAAQWSEFIDDLRKLFGDIDISVRFNEETDEHIVVFVDNGGGWVPIELAGTGVLQAVQILGYVHYFHPSVIVLDEPDSHLHPNNQRLLCSLLQGVAEERDTQVVLTTHSRHVVDALGGQAAFVWVRNSTAEKMNQDHDVAVLLDIGALDVKEMLSQTQAKCIVLTEDSLTRGLKVLLESSGIPMEDTLVLAYYGCTTPHNLRPLLGLIRGSNANAKIVVHRDRDYLTAQEASDWEQEIRNQHADPFLTSGVDVESHFLHATHLAALNGLGEAEMQALIDAATDEAHPVSTAKYVNGRVDIVKKAGNFGALDVGALAVEAPGVMAADPARYRHSKTVLKVARRVFQEQHGRNLRAVEVSAQLGDPNLSEIARRI